MAVVLTLVCSALKHFIANQVTFEFILLVRTSNGALTLSAEARNVQKVDLTGRTGTRMAWKNACMATRLFFATSVATGVSHVIGVAFGLANRAAEAIISRQRLAVVIAAFGTGPHEVFLSVFVFVVVENPFFGTFQMEGLETLSAVPNIIVVFDVEAAN